jgi:hypothetical protein
MRRCPIFTRARQIEPDTAVFAGNLKMALGISGGKSMMRWRGTKRQETSGRAIRYDNP